jgi:hypothetical protein
MPSLDRQIRDGMSAMEGMGYCITYIPCVCGVDSRDINLHSSTEICLAETRRAHVRSSLLAPARRKRGTSAGA